MSEPIYVALAMPRQGGMTEGAAKGFYLWPMKRTEERSLLQLASKSSLLNHCFNTLWSSALNCRDQFGVTHFAMIHSDIGPSPWWLDTLLDELVRLDADVVSAVVPMKGPAGLTSTAVDSDDPWEPRRLMMREVHKLPETFGPEDVGGPLLLNTGLWVCDLRKPWAEDVVFNSMERIIKKPDGEYEPQVISEDWLLSRRLNEFGCKLYATRRVAVEHEGTIEFTNTHPWGTESRDEKHYQRMAERAKTNGHVLEYTV